MSGPQDEMCEDCGAVGPQGSCYMVAVPWEDGKPKRHFFLCAECWTTMVERAVLSALRGF